MALPELTTYKYLICGDGQTRNWNLSLKCLFLEKLSVNLPH